MSQELPRLFINLYIDEDISIELAETLRQKGYDAIAAQEVGRLEKSDDEQLAFAASQGRAIVTFNTHDFPDLYA